jgi:hypothetical protein
MESLTMLKSVAAQLRKIADFLDGGGEKKVSTYHGLFLNSAELSRELYENLLRANILTWNDLYDTTPAELADVPGMTCEYAKEVVFALNRNKLDYLKHHGINSMASLMNFFSSP